MTDAATRLQRTPLFETHRTLGARMTAFAGWEMPVNYPAGILREHFQTRASASLFDTCHMGELRVEGPRAAEALNLVLARRVEDQAVGSCRYNLIVADDGGIIDDLIGYRMEANRFLLVVNAGRGTSDAAFLRDRLPRSIGLTDESDSTGKIDLQGPASVAVLTTLGLVREDLPGYFRWRAMEIAGESVLISRTGYTGELGFELYMPVEQALPLWERILGVPGVAPAGLGARDTLRIEAGLPLYGHELSPEVNPLEAGFGGMLARGMTERLRVMMLPVRKRLTGLALEHRRAARAGAVVRGEGSRRGTVTSGSFAPSLGHAVAFAYMLGEEELREGDRVRVGEPGQELAATVVRPPFYREGSARRSI